jgi:hypothetical protein
MTTHFSMGAINKETSKYEYPKIASKKNKYKCPSCDKDVIFRKGKIKAPHYAHKKSETPCFYYDKPSESEIHKDAKMLLKILLNNKQNICINKRCKYKYCKFETIEDYYERDNLIDSEFIDSYYNENTQAFIEYRFHYNDSNRSSDVALVEDKQIKYIFEICYKNKTKEENRPEPWVEIKAIDLINNVNTCEVDNDGFLYIDCIRDYKCDYCVECEEIERKRERKREEWERERDEWKRKREEREEREREEREEREREEWERKREEREEREREEWERKREEREEWERELKIKIDEWNEIEREQIRKLEENLKEIRCKRKCDINEPCICETPKYILVLTNNEYYCNRCRKWKCRCQ